MAGKILVVDDDAANRELLEEFLVAEGLEVVTARDGRSSIEAFAQFGPDLAGAGAVTTAQKART